MSLGSIRLDFFSEFLRDSAKILEEFEVNCMSLWADLPKLDLSQEYPTFASKIVERNKSTDNGTTAEKKVETAQTTIEEKAQINPIPEKPAQPSLPPKTIPKPQPQNPVMDMFGAPQINQNQYFVPNTVQNNFNQTSWFYNTNSNISTPQNNFIQMYNPVQPVAQPAVQNFPNYSFNSQTQQKKQRLDPITEQNLRAFILNLLNVPSVESSFLISKARAQFPNVSESKIRRLLHKMIKEGTFH